MVSIINLVFRVNMLKYCNRAKMCIVHYEAAQLLDRRNSS